MAQRSIGQEQFGFAGRERAASSLDALVSLIDWGQVAALLDPLYPAVKGEPAWPPLAMFKALLLSIWYDLSDVKLAEALDGADVVVMVHADHQYDAALVADMVEPILAGRADAVMGSRLLEDRAIAGGMPRWKWVGNRALTTMENVAFRKHLSEYHTGYRAFSVDFLRTIPFHRNSDGFVFDQEIFAQLVHRGARIVEMPIPTRYFLEASSVSFPDSVRYGLETLGVLARFRVDERRRDDHPAGVHGDVARQI